MENENILLVINSTPVSEKHLTLFVKEEISFGGPKLILNELVEVMYKHPDAPDDMLVSHLEVHRLGEYAEPSRKDLVVLDAAYDTVYRQQFRQPPKKS